MMQFMLVQLLGLILLFLFPQLVLWLPAFMQETKLCNNNAARCPITNGRL